MKSFHLSVAVGKRQQPKNHTYEHELEISSFEQFKQAVQWDNCGGIFKEHHRSNDNFISADCLLMDCDNEKSDNSQFWLTPDIFAEKTLGVTFYVVCSKSNMKDKYDKNGKISKSARPRFHVYFPLSETCTDAKKIRDMKEKFLRVFPDFDSGAKDAARFFYGVENPVCGVQEGSMYIDEFLDTVPDIELHDATDTVHSKSTEHKTNDSEVIPDGKRHNYLLQVAMQALGKYGIGETARKIFDNACLNCQQPLDLQNVNAIWTWAVNQAQSFKERYTPKRQTLTLPIIEQTLKQFNIDVRFDVISHRLSISDLPLDNPYIPESYSATNGFTRKTVNKEMLPLLLNSYLRDKNFTFSESFLNDALNAIAQTHSYNPFLDFIKSITWDGENRVYELCQVLGITSENVHYMIFFEKWLWQVVSMCLNDDGSLGNDFVLVLQGPQGVGKTSFFRMLAVRPEWFKEGACIDMNNKDSIIEATSVVICELGELEATINREQPSLKNFITRNFDEYRPPYGKSSVPYVRRTALCGTVNSEQFLRDSTGNRRYVVIPVRDMDLSFIHHVMTPDYCSQLWRQVYEQYYLKRGKNGFRLSVDERAFSEERNAQSTVLKDGEIELYDLLDWNLPVTSWHWYTNSELIKSLELRISATKMGNALNSIRTKDKRVRKDRKNNCNVYLLPPKKNSLYD